MAKGDKKVQNEDLTIREKELTSAEFDYMYEDEKGVRYPELLSILEERGIKRAKKFYDDNKYTFDFDELIRDIIESKKQKYDCRDIYRESFHKGMQENKGTEHAFNIAKRDVSKYYTDNNFNWELQKFLRIQRGKYEGL